MSSDLERDLQLALREGVGHVTPERLRHDGPTRPTPTRRVRWAVAGPILAAACVAVLAVAITLVATNRNSSSTQTTTGRPAPLASLVGTSWTLVSVRHSGTTTSIPQSSHAGVQFRQRSVLGADDGVNGYSATYALGRREIFVRGGYGTLIGYVGRDPGRLAAIKGISSILYSAGGGAARHAITVRLRAGTLTLAANGYTLTLTHPLPVASSSAPVTTSGSSSR